MDKHLKLQNTPEKRFLTFRSASLLNFRRRKAPPVLNSVSFSIDISDRNIFQHLHFFSCQRTVVVGRGNCVFREGDLKTVKQQRSIKSFSYF
jgi:hypothetical protein